MKACGLDRGKPGAIGRLTGAVCDKGTACWDVPRLGVEPSVKVAGSHDTCTVVSKNEMLSYNAFL